jgi:hypothetical protein
MVDRSVKDAWCKNLTREGLNKGYFYSYNSQRLVLTSFKPWCTDNGIHGDYYLRLSMYIHTDRYNVMDGTIRPTHTHDSFWLTLGDDDDWIVQRGCHSYDELIRTYLRWPIIIDKGWIWAMNFY